MSVTRPLSALASAIAVWAVAASTANAAPILVQQPTASYVAGTQLLPITAADFDAVLSLTNGVETVDFDIPMVALTVPTTWATWGSPPDTETATPRVLWTNGLTLLTLTSVNPVFTFGVEVQPNTAVPSLITARFLNGATVVATLVLTVDGNAGARLFAITDTDPFDRIELSSTDDFAIGQVRVASVAAVPEPATGVLLVVGGLVGLIRARRSFRAERS